MDANVERRKQDGIMGMYLQKKSGIITARKKGEIMEMEKKDVGIFKLLNIAGGVTLLGLVLSVLAALCVVKGKPELAVSLLYFVILCDRLDGAIARKLNQVSPFGAELDNLSDAIAFGFVPGLFLVVVSGTAWMILPALFMLLAGVLRLARYSYVGLVERNGKKYYVGLPIPYTAALLFLIWPVVREFDGTIRSVVLALFAVVVGWFMVSTIPFAKGTRFQVYVLFVVYPLIMIYYVVRSFGVELW
jgi:CDP-diacylglycerol--serine O-phosphatidyltransferase